MRREPATPPVDEVNRRRLPGTLAPLRL